MIKERPITVTLVCLYLLLVGSVLLVMSFTNLQDTKVQAAMTQIDIPYKAQVAVLYVNLALMVLCAMFMFQEKNWARWVYLAWGLLHLGYLYFIQPDFFVNWIDTVTYPVFALLLLLPNANDYFSSDSDYIG